jgi:ferredoxin
MHDFLRGTRTEIAVRKNWSAATYTMAESWNVLPRQNPPSLESDKRAASLEIVEVDYSESEARRQASRCLRCNVNTVFDTSICVACNGCVDICPENLIRLVGLSQLVRDDQWMERAAEEFGDLGGYTDRQLDEMGAVMMKDETTCIRCAMCASRCPTHAILMKHFDFHRACVTVPTRNPKVKYG